MAGGEPVYRLFIANKNYSSWSLRPWILMHELGIAFEEKMVPFTQGSSWDTFRTFCPSGKVPCLQDGDEVVWDSLGITGYLAERHDGVWPEDGKARTWARCAVAEMHSGFSALRDECGMNVGLRIKLHGVSSGLRKDLDRLDELWSEGLARFGGSFLAGTKFSAVDAFFAPVAFRVQTYDLPLSKIAAAYCSRLLTLPGMQLWQREALAETWRDLAHEAEVLQYGDVVQDLR
jgi:glutathione S-transferase